jgi:hypothetical protein
LPHPNTFQVTKLSSRNWALVTIQLGIHEISTAETPLYACSQISNNYQMVKSFSNVILLLFKIGIHWLRVTVIENAKGIGIKAVIFANTNLTIP